ncbi:hypothetical protein DSOL_5195 [Desulfosporosinus metallidurans]|uniref:Uncharacterized protein n=1 Tax=Desulfosporosinus metallidurans TaxID=1888891 RepID=A0A1Q8QEV1_9FIRM|nr:hypothetical protein DSOL_5195 [Desulfosporosinus metallidurans]
MYPASLPGVVAVGALAKDNKIAPFSNTGNRMGNDIRDAKSSEEMDLLNMSLSDGSFYGANFFSITLPIALEEIDTAGTIIEPKIRY